MTKSAFKKIHSLKEVASYLKDPLETLVIFDVDYVLMQPQDPSYQFVNFARHLKIVRSIFGSLTPQERDLFSNLMVMGRSESILIEEEAPQVIEDFQSQEFDLLALTAALTLKNQQYNFKEERFKRLSSFGFHFQAKPYGNFSQTFESFNSNFGNYPLYERGVLFANGENKMTVKGKVLEKWLLSKPNSYKHLVFVDDRDQNLSDVQTCLEKNYEIDALLYQGALSFPSKEVGEEEFISKWEQLAQEAKGLSRSIEF